MTMKTINDVLKDWTYGDIDIEDLAKLVAESYDCDPKLTEREIKNFNTLLRALYAGFPNKFSKVKGYKWGKFNCPEKFKAKEKTPFTM